MLVREIQIKGFNSYKTPAKLSLPPTGIVLVTGDNGAGKSTWPEAVSYGGWGKTLRGESPWRQGEKGTVALKTEDFQISRTKTKLSFSTGAEAGKFETKAQAQAALDSHTGLSWEVWKRVHVFSSSDANNFSLATDGERKRLIEFMLGTNKFDQALKLLRDDMRVLTSREQQLEYDLGRVQLRKSNQLQRLDDAEKWLAETQQRITEEDPTDLKSLRDELFNVEAQIEKLREQALVLKQQKALASIEVERAERKVEDTQRSVDRFKSGDCPTCSRPMDADDLAELSATVELAKKQALRERVDMEDSVLDIEESLSDLRERAKDAQTARDDIRSRLAASEDQKRRFELQSQQVEKFKKRRVEMEESLRSRQEELAQIGVEEQAVKKRAAATASELKVLRVAESVLGLKGVRVHIMGKVLQGIEDVANVWLGSISKGLSLEIKPYKEKKTGGVTDAIALNVVHPEGTRSYKSCSAGERRRVDISVLMALAEVASATYGVEGTLWLDEVFDSLDSDGVAAVCQTLPRIAEQRPVVVITHSPELVRKLTVDAHYHVSKGAITQVA